MSHEWLNRQFFRGVSVITRKDIRIYYTKPPVIIFGLLFPLFMFLAFYLGKRLDFGLFFPGLLAMFIFFIASSVGPLITPWEKQAGTYERLLSFPVTINTIILGDTVAGMVFSIMINLVVLAAGLIFLRYDVKVILLAAAVITGAFCFSSLGVLLASPSVPNPSYIMMISSLIRFPLVFISGIFIPLETLKGVGLALACCSPITYLVDLMNLCLRGRQRFSIWADFAALLFFTALFIASASGIHRKNLMRGL
ncbi:ABC transporter permease [bacterium]|nr:ABC transporter permease [bacterium]